jgi:hypothetical protein
MENANLRIVEALALSALLHLLILAPLQQSDGAVQAPTAWGPLIVTVGGGAERPDADARGEPGAGPAARGAHDLARNPARQARDATRPAVPDEVTVKVLLFTDDPGNPQNALDIGGQRYIYFNSPGLRQQVRPLSELRLRYPVAIPEDPDGSVVLQLLIDERGLLEGVSVLCAAPGFETSARESIAGLRFSPARGRDGPVKSFMLVEFGYGRGVPCDRIPD